MTLSLSALPTSYPELIDQQSNLAAAYDLSAYDLSVLGEGDEDSSGLSALTPLSVGFGSAATIALGWYAAHKLENRNAMYGMMVAAPLVDFAVGRTALPQPGADALMLEGFAGGALLSEAIGGVFGYLFKRDFVAGATGGAITSMLYTIYTTLNK